ncbi:N-formylglutamate amidohydrolase [Acidocella sp. KAb 2-4]|uniref:N-formylglutamate amidohydrolase n=1 Tax=Acidocella sp. KAb 2-4 TaxID=2885158 RepID=UPI001D061B7A|nr:N-formylglutamate amidohydrolase [Acidocella sp. KAb 2-4]MCB5945874.1 N-formylglutamate amidohydrolase [Acidocella sp. KAb 2-4]
MTDSSPFTLLRPARQSAPLVLTSPHSGRRYGEDFLAQARLDALAIRRSEDSFVDELFAAAPALGVPLLAANFPRAWCDANREPWELDPAMFADELPDYVNRSSPRVAAGLGTIARIVGTGEPIYTRKLSFAEAKTRIETCWRPFHEALAELIEETLIRFGHCFVVDCHSMPTPLGRHSRRPDIVLGDGHGTSCAPGWTAHIESLLHGQGFSVRRNDPYAGGFITRHYGRPREGVQVVQLELARSLYMHERQFTRHAGFAGIEARLGGFVGAMAEAVRLWGAAGPGFCAAAE